MAIVHKSTIRRARQAVKRHDRNHATLGALKSLIKKVQAAVAEKKLEDAQISLRQATSALGKAVTTGGMKPNTPSRRMARHPFCHSLAEGRRKGVMKPNTASRRIARLTLHVNSLSASPS